MADNKNIIIAIILIALALFFFKDILFSIFNVSIPLVVTSAVCTGTLSTGPITQADCNSFGPAAYGSSGWGFSTAGEGTITLTDSAKSAVLTANYRNIGGTASLMAYNYALGNYQILPIAYDIDNSIGEQSIPLAIDYLDPGTHTIIKLKWDMACPQSQCVAGAENLRVTQFDSIDTTSTTTTIMPISKTVSRAATVVSVSTTSLYAPWTNANNIFLRDSVYATAIISNATGNRTKNIKATGFNFDIPSTATIDGVTVTFSSRYDLITSGRGNIQHWMAPTVSSSPPTSTLGTLLSFSKIINTSYTFSNINVIDLNSPGFGFSYYTGRTAPGSTVLGGTVEYSVNLDYVNVTVAYTYIPETTTTTSTSVITTSTTSTTPTSTIVTTSTIPTTSILTTTSTIPTTSVLTTSTTPTTSIAPSTSVITTTTLSTIPTTSILGDTSTTSSSTSTQTTVISGSQATTSVLLGSTSTTTTINPTLLENAKSNQSQLLILTLIIFLVIYLGRREK